MLLKKMKKAQLIKMIEDLQTKIKELNLSKTKVVKDYIVVDGKETKQITYLKKRIRSTNDKKLKELYTKELKRLVEEQS